MTINLEHWSLDEATGLTNFYNEQTADLPYAHAVSAEEFDWGIQNPWWHDQSPCDNLKNEELIVAKEKGQIIGFIHVADEKISHDKKQPPSGIIRFLSYTPGYRDAGQKLLDAAETRFRKHGFSQAYAFLGQYAYRFHVLGYGVSEQQGHIVGLLGLNGYQIHSGAVFMEDPNFEIEEPILPDPDVEIQVTETAGRGDRPNLHVEAYRDGERFGVCATISLAHRHPVDALQDTFFVIGMGVNGGDQNRGWGRYLLLRSHWENQKLGYRHASISTSTDNYRALLFYTNCGYHVRDVWYEYGKNLNVDSNIVFDKTFTC